MVDPWGGEPYCGGKGFWGIGPGCFGKGGGKGPFGEPPMAYMGDYGCGSRGGKKGEMEPGDWFCPSCGDHQFKRNHCCRKCGTPNPFGSAKPDQLVCSVHGKSRTKKNLVDDGEGGMRCAPGMECQSSGSSRFSPY